MPKTEGEKGVISEFDAGASFMQQELEFRRMGRRDRDLPDLRTKQKGNESDRS